MSGTAFILDGYVDEPACLGVPPYISPYIRTVAGALL
jgi:radical SAM superfamily enzyme with C-terminal helix-hairpin-helix motif